MVHINDVCDDITETGKLFNESGKKKSRFLILPKYYTMGPTQRKDNFSKK